MALTTDLWNYRGLIGNLAQRELKARYRGSILGFIWTFLNPLLLMAVYALVYNLVRAVIVRAAARQRTTADRISFTDALRWLLSAASGEALPELVINPSRPGRREPRVIKDYFDTYPRMRRPRQVLRAKPPTSKR